LKSEIIPINKTVRNNQNNLEQHNQNKFQKNNQNKNNQNSIKNLFQKNILTQTSKKIISAGVCVSIACASLTSALALATLDSYPAPFVKDGNFDALIVIGKNALAEDVLGAVDIGASLQYAMRQVKSIPVGDAESVIDKGVKVKGTGSEKLNYGEYLGTVKGTAMDDSELPDILAKGKFKESHGTTKNEESYTQELTFSKSNGQVLYDRPDEVSTADDFLEILSNTEFYNYTLRFDGSVDFDTTNAGKVEEDFQGASIELQGQKFTITDAKATSGKITELRLQAGDTLLWLSQDQIVEKTVNGFTHIIKVVDVTNNENSCGVSVDGDVAWIDVNSDETINGLSISILGAKAVHAELQDMDICQVNIGSTELLLKQGSNVEMDGKEIKDAEVNLQIGSPGSGEWNGFSIAYTPDEDLFLQKNQSMTDPTFGLFKIMMEGVLTTREDITLLSQGSSDAEFKFTNNENKEVKVPLHYESSYPSNAMSSQIGTGSYIFFGKDENKPLLIDDGNTSADASYDAAGNSGDFFICGSGSTGSLSSCKGVKIWFVSSGGTAHVLEISKIDTDNTTGGDGLVSIKDLTSGKIFEDRKYVDASVGTKRDNVTNVDLGNLGTLAMYFYESTETGGSENEVAGTIAISSAVLASAETQYGAQVQLNPSLNLAQKRGDNTEVLAVESSEDDVDDANIINDGGLTKLGASAPVNSGKGNLILLSAWHSSSDSRLNVGFGGKNTSLTDRSSDAPTENVNSWPKSGVDKTDGSDTRIAETAHGTLIEYDSSDEKFVKVHYPKEETEVNVFIAPVSAVSSVTSGTIETTTINQINIQSTVTDEEITDIPSHNLIIIGGPCINKIAAKLLGNPDPCTTGFKKGSAIIRLLDNGDKVAMLIAGYDAGDTRRAATAVAQYKKYQSGFKGTQAEVTGTSIYDITVKTPT